MLERETIIPFTTEARVNLYLSRPAGTDAAWLTSMITMLSGEAMKRVMKRAIEKKARVEYFDLISGEEKIYVLAPPIDTDIAPILVNNLDFPRVWTQAEDIVDADYVTCDPDRAERGEILVQTSLSAGRNSLKVSYTGGMATGTASGDAGSGVDGACSDPGGGTNNLFTSLTGKFVTKGVAAGDILTITGGTNAGTYTVLAVIGETSFTVALAVPFPTVPTTDEVWSVSAAALGLINLYPDLALALDIQTVQVWQDRLKWGIQSEGVVGASYQFMRPLNFLPKVMDILMQYSRDSYGL